LTADVDGEPPAPELSVNAGNIERRRG